MAAAYVRWQTTARTEIVDRGMRPTIDNEGYIYIGVRAGIRFRRSEPPSQAASVARCFARFNAAITAISEALTVSRSSAAPTIRRPSILSCT